MLKTDLSEVKRNQWKNPALQLCQKVRLHGKQDRLDTFSRIGIQSLGGWRTIVCSMAQTVQKSVKSTSCRHQKAIAAEGINQRRQRLMMRAWIMPTTGWKWTRQQITKTQAKGVKLRPLTETIHPSMLIGGIWRRCRNRRRSKNRELGDSRRDS